MSLDHPFWLKSTYYIFELNSVRRLHMQGMSHLLCNHSMQSIPFTFCLTILCFAYPSGMVSNVKRLRATHFIRIPIATAKSTPQIRRSTEHVAQDPIASALPRFAWLGPNEMKYSLGLLSLETRSHVESAIELLNSISRSCSANGLEESAGECDLHFLWRPQHSFQWPRTIPRVSLYGLDENVARPSSLEDHPMSSLLGRFSASRSAYCSIPGILRYLSWDRSQSSLSGYKIRHKKIAKLDHITILFMWEQSIEADFARQEQDINLSGHNSPRSQKIPRLYDVGSKKSMQRSDYVWERKILW